MKHVHIPVAVLSILLVALLVGILLAGLVPKSWDSANHARRTGSPVGLEFAGNGIAYAEGLELPRVSDFSLTLEVTPAPIPANGFGFILVLDNGHDSDQLVVGQWHSGIIAMNGTDYAHVRRLPRVTYDLRGHDGGSVVLRLSSGSSGTSLTADGELVDHRSASLTLPGDGRRGTRLVLGNSVYASSPWWGTVNNVIVAVDDESGPIPIDLRSLEIPGRVTPLRRQILAVGMGRGSSVGNLLFDIVINLLGFIPLGVLATALLLAVTDRSRRFVVAVTVAGGAFLSLGLELTQAWIPTRSSSLLDLALNTLGTALGAVAAAWLLSRAMRGPAHKADASARHGGATGQSAG
jgi:VanZ family protein